MSDDLHDTLAAAGIDPASLGPFAALVEACFAAAKAGAERATLSVDLALGESDFDPWRIYTYDEAATYLRLSDSSRISEISEHDLPRVRVGMRRGRVGILGADLLCYAKGMPPVDYGGIRDGWLDQVRRSEHAPVPAPRALPGTSGRKRLL